MDEAVAGCAARVAEDVVVVRGCDVNGRAERERRREGHRGQCPDVPGNPSTAHRTNCAAVAVDWQDLLDW